MQVDNEISSLVNDIALNDSQKSFNELFRIYYQRIYRFVWMHIPNEQDVEDILTEVFSALWENRKDLPLVNNFAAYIYSIARHKIMDMYRTQEKGEPFSLPEEDFNLFSGTTTSPEDNMISQETVDYLNGAVEELPAKCKLILKLVREDHMKYRDVAVLLQISEKTVEAQMSIAMKKLRQSLKNM